MKNNKFYVTFAEAQQATKRLGIGSSTEYNKRYKEDPRLPSDPKGIYFKEWPIKNGWDIFSNKNKNKKLFYSTFAEAQQAVVRLGIRFYGDYKKRYKEDPHLPSNPNKIYSKEWPTKNGWVIFTKRTEKFFYPTLADAQKAAIILGINSRYEYKARYKEDSRLPSEPQRKYSKEWPSTKGWTIFLGKEIKYFYPTLFEAQQAVVRLGISSYSEYNNRYKEDPRLPSEPKRTYPKEWAANKGWATFLGKEIKVFYPTFNEAQQATKRLGIGSFAEYNKRYKEDPRLPSQPRSVYSKKWPTKHGWTTFLGREIKYFYLTFNEAQQATKRLGIGSFAEYNKRYKEDPLLPSHPATFYSENWPVKKGWTTFIATEKKNYYPTFYEAQQATKRLGISSCSEYEKRYKEDPLLPSHPAKIYHEDWPVKKGWASLLGKEIKIFYSTFVEAQQAVIKLGIRSSSEYSKRYKEDPKLTSTPVSHYADEWPLTNGWIIFLGKEIKEFYSTLFEVKKAIIKLGIGSHAEYLQRYKEDPKLPCNLSHQYFGRKTNSSLIIDFFVPNKIKSFSQLVKLVKNLKISNSTEYREKRKKYNVLPSNPKRSFPNDFIDWYHLCDIPRPYKYSKLQCLVANNKITTIAMYQKWRVASKDPHIPSNPHESSNYKKSWVNWYVFFGLEEPFQPEYLHAPYLSWRDEINEFMRFAKGAKTKKSHLCKFVRLYVQKHQLGTSPIDFVFNKAINIASFKTFLSQEISQARIYNAIDEFIDFIVKTKCSDEDPETGEFIRMFDAKNRIKDAFIPDVSSNSTPDETVKPALSYQYIQALRNWTIPPNAKTFSDLEHLHIFDADWIKVPLNIIDKDDPDCIYKVIDGTYAKIWVPTYWLHAYALFSVPLRGVQLAYNDSGEADAYIPEYKEGKIVWIKNTHELAGLTKNQGMIKRYPNDEFGMFSTSNKTSMNTGSQSVPWMPVELAYWLIKLRKWQSKYNPIQAPKAWLNCQRTNLNELQRKNKGVNCFLFRDFGEEECGTFGGRLAWRLAAGLYFSQERGVKLARREGKLSALTKYKSEFTPHSMRVSLITIYVMEYNLDLSIIMKIAGHSSIIMSVYYVKTQGSALRKKIEEGEKIALKSQANATQSLIEQLRIDEIKPNLIGNSQETLNALNNNIPVGNYLFRDWGICPHAGTRCEDGGSLIGGTQARSPVPTGYLGGENCIRCRHFITGPAFIGGLLAIFQEIILYLEAKQLHYDELIKDEDELVKALDKEDENEYICIKNNEKFNPSIRKEILASIRKTRSEYEVVAKKMDMLYCDLGAVSTLVHQCQALLNQSNLSIDNDDSNLQLIVRPEHELQVIAEEVSQYELLCEVCENSEIYQSASADLAITPRTQLIDNMMLKNNLKPLLFTLTKKQQLKAGNQLNKLFKERLKSHVKVNDLIEGKLLLSDLQEHERIEPVDLLSVLHQQRIDIKEI